MSKSPINIAERLERLEALHNVTKVIYSTLDQRESLQRILGEAVRLTGATSGSLCLVNPRPDSSKSKPRQGSPLAPGPCA